MRCRKAQKLLVVSFDGELDDARARAAGAHLVECRVCRRFVDALPGCTQALDLLTVPEPRSRFTDRLIARLPETRGRLPWLREWLEALRPAPVAAAVLAAACGVVMALSMNGKLAPQVSAPQDPTVALYSESFDALPDQSAGARYLALLHGTGE